ncbi:MAG TPA: POTRA domain-containing protein, partial [Gemmataceae bacterium]|nr:POTRA domain-containing protein [Gemmataceae bacterium]
MKATDRVSGGGSGMIGPLVGTLVLLCLGAAPSLAQAPADKVIVADVIPQFIAQGNQSVSPQKVMSLVKIRAGMEYQATAVNEDVRRLWDTKLFADIRVVIKPTEDKKVIVIFQLKELPGVIQEIQYLGANHMKKEDLESLSGLKAGLPLNPWATQKARQAIIAKYHEKGRLSASVDVLEGDKVGDTRVVFNITEGPVAKVGGIDFIGNSFVTGPRLRTQVNSSRPFLGIIGGDFNPLMADNDITKLEEYYKSHGFHDVQVRRELKWDGSQQYVRLIFHIHEGQRYRVAGIDITGVSSKEREELLPLIKHVKPGEIYSQGKMEADRNRLVDWKGYQGQQTVVQEALYYPPDKPGQMVLNYEVSERPTTRVGQVIIYGNEVTKDNVIRRQVNLFPGQVLTYPDLRLAERNLARLNIFELKPEMGIRPTVSVLDDQDGEFKDVGVYVQETQTGSLLFGVGVNSDAGVNGTIVLNERNFDIMNPPTKWEDLLSGRAFRGGGQEFRIEAVPGNQLQRYSVTFREPFLFDSPYSFSIGAYYYNRIFNEYQEARVGSR